MRELYIGLMSGTSMDGADGVLVDFSEAKPAVQRSASRFFATELRAEMLALNASGTDELHRAALTANALARVYAEVVRELLAFSGVQAGDVRAIGAHGQTVRHRPGAFDGTGYTLQLNAPALLAELTGIAVACDFRTRDVAAGGQGAPLAPFFHQAMFAREGQAVAVLNIGGISNITLLHADGRMQGFDCGPGNALMDLWCMRHTGQPFDRDGEWAARGHVDAALLDAMLSDPYFAAAPPKSTGRDLFNATWLEQHLGSLARKPEDVQATLAELTARSCAAELLRHGPYSRALLACGGGALNGHLMTRLRALLPRTLVESTQVHGVPPLQVEALAFAWLARKCVRNEKLELKSATGALGARVLGCLYPA